MLISHFPKQFQVNLATTKAQVRSVQAVLVEGQQLYYDRMQIYKHIIAFWANATGLNLDVFGDEIPDAPKGRERGRSGWFRYPGWRWDWTTVLIAV
jgi:hypothetical protein